MGWLAKSRQIPSGHFFDHFLDGNGERNKIVFTNPEYLVCINIEIMMGNDIAEALNARPVDLRIFCEKSSTGDSVDILEAFTDGEKEHGNPVKPLHTFGRTGEILDTFNLCCSVRYFLNGLINL